MEFNLADLYESVTDAIPDKDAFVVYGEHRLTFSELDRRANRLAHFLSAQGLGPGDHIGLHMYNGAEFVEAMLAAFKIRAVPINVNYRYVSEELKYIFENAELKALIHNRELTALVEEVAPEVPMLKTIITVDDGSGVDTEELGSIGYEEALADQSPERDFGPRSADDLYIVYTGGTTGMPRGVMWRQEDVFFAGLQGGRPGGEPIETPEEIHQVAASGDAEMTVIPAASFIHGAAQWTAWLALLSGGKVVIVPGRGFRPEAVWRAVEEEEVTTIALVGDAMARPLADTLPTMSPAPEVSSLFVIASAGAVLSDTVKDALQEQLPYCMILNNFGASEAGHTGQADPESDPDRPRFYMVDTVSVLDPNDGWKQVEPGSGTMGMLARRGRLPLGYYKDPEKTAKTFIEVDGVRWSVPGDMATIDDDGAIVVFGRGSQCINSGGAKIFPEEVEQAIKSHPAVFDAVVVAKAHERWGEQVAAVLALREDHEATEEAIEELVRAKIAGFKVPRVWVFVEEVVRHPSGKPDYRWARTVAEAGGDFL